MAQTPIVWKAKRQDVPCPKWVCGTVKTPTGEIPRVSTDWSREDRIGQIKSRIGAFRMKYTVEPGLYAVGSPDDKSDVFASANYKLSFDILRRELGGLNAYILVLDTKGINVWCAAGKGAFGTAELIARIRRTGLEKTVAHRMIILPQLGAPGIRAHLVREQTGFTAIYGPVHARDIGEFVKAGYRASRRMRTVSFPLLERAELTPMEIVPAMKKYPLYALIVLLMFGLTPEGVMFAGAWSGGLPFLLMGLLSVFAGAFLTPVFLPFIPFRSFALKGLIVGAAVALASVGPMGFKSPLLDGASYVFFPALSSYVALQFTGSTPFTGMSGVKKEMKYAIPAYIASLAVSVIIVIIYKINSWGML